MATSPGGLAGDAPGTGAATRRSLITALIVVTPPSTRSGYQLTTLDNTTACSSKETTRARTNVRREEEIIDRESKVGEEVR